MIHKKLLNAVRVKPGSKVRLSDYPTDVRGFKDVRALATDELKERSLQILDENREQLSQAQELLYSSDVYSVLIVLQAMDAAGKDGTIRHVMSGLNPQGCQVFSFKKPSDEELDHDFLWRYARCLPERGRIGIFNRSYYEEVLVVRVHPEILAKQRLPPGPRGDGFWRRRYEDINAFEHHLVRNGTLILKFFLNLSKKEQKRRFLERLSNPEKHWKFSDADIQERGFWGDYTEAFEQMLRHTSTDWAPWHVIPADRKYATRAIVADVISQAVKGLKLKRPKIGPDRMRQLAAARRKLERES